MGQAILSTNNKLLDDYYYWMEGEAEAAKFYAKQPPPIPGVMPKDYDLGPHIKAQFRVMRHAPRSPLEAFIVVDTMAAWTEGGGEVPLSGLKGLKKYISSLLRSNLIDETESALATSILRSAKPVEGRA